MADPPSASPIHKLITYQSLWVLVPTNNDISAAVRTRLRQQIQSDKEPAWQVPEHAGAAHSSRAGAPHSQPLRATGARPSRHPLPGKPTSLPAAPQALGPSPEAPKWGGVPRRLWMEASLQALHTLTRPWLSPPTCQPVSARAGPLTVPR